MTSFLKGNYDLPKKPQEESEVENEPKNLTERFEDSVLAKLGGSICFVTKDNTLLWAGDEDETTSK